MSARAFIVIAAVVAMYSSGVGHQNRSRKEAIPPDAVKVTPENDAHPPVLHSDEFETPVPLPSPVNTAGAEDGPYISEDGRTLWFFFTPDVRVSAQKQLLDGVTGIWMTRLERNGWTEPVRVVLQSEGRLALDGAPCVQGDVMWFCSAREDNYRAVDMWTARRRGGQWTDWQNAGARLNRDMQIGEVHLTRDGKELYFHANRTEGKGGLDIWRTRRQGDGWGAPVAVRAVNTVADEGWPFVTADGRELWFLRTHLGSPAIFRSRLKKGEWTAPVLIVSQFAGEPSLDRHGNLYFVHHFFHHGKMIEADIYVARKRLPSSRGAAAGIAGSGRQ